jgi:hypothetical protein
VRGARGTARAAQQHPKEAASLAGLTTAAAGVVALVVVVKIVRSRRFRSGLGDSAKRGAFGPGVAAATTVAEKVQEHRATSTQV